MRDPKTRPLVFPVIHIRSDHGSLTHVLENADMAFEAGADGVFLISMDGHDELLRDLGREVKKRHEDKLVGLNYLTLSAEQAIARSAGAGMDMTWSDNAQTHSSQPLDRAVTIAAALSHFKGHQFFGGVAFKYQREEPFPDLAAIRAADLGFVPTTSGPGTGAAADPAKIMRMSKALRGGNLAIASGITPDNVLTFAPYLSHILVATGVSKNEHDFEFELLCQLMGKIRSNHPDLS